MENRIIKRSYIFVRKTREKMKEIFESKANIAVIED